MKYQPFSVSISIGIIQNYVGYSKLGMRKYLCGGGNCVLGRLNDGVSGMGGIIDGNLCGWDDRIG